MKRTERSNHSLLPDKRKMPFYRRRHIVSMLPGVLLFLVLLAFMLFRYQLIFTPTGEPPRKILEKQIIGTQNTDLPERATARPHSQKPQQPTKSTRLLSAQSPAPRKTIPPPPPPITVDIPERSIDPAIVLTPATPANPVTDRPTPVTLPPAEKIKRTGHLSSISSRALAKLKKSLNNKHVLEALVLPVKKKKNIDVRRASSRALEKLMKKKPDLP